MLQAFIGTSDHAEAKRLTEWKTLTFIEAFEISACRDLRVAVVRLT